jgi:F420-0:gamma-glutamyl ligase
VPAGVIAIPIRTELVHPISESAVAISQGEFVAAEHVRPSRLAYVLSRRAGPLATMSQPESVQLVIDRAGRWRVLCATLAHLVARTIGHRGAFYEVMGDAVAAVDGYTGTMPPFERAIVFSPRDPDGFAASFRERTAIECAVVDANDLTKAKVLGASPDVNRKIVAAALLDNPHGNSDEQTPVVVLKWRGKGANPLC